MTPSSDQPEKLKYQRATITDDDLLEDPRPTALAVSIVELRREVAELCQKLDEQLPK